MKTKEELNAIKDAYATLAEKLLELSEDELNVVTGGIYIDTDSTFEEVTECLKEISKLAWEKTGGNASQLWFHINEAEKAETRTKRQKNIVKAQNELPNYKDQFSLEEYNKMSITLRDGYNATK